LVDGMVGTREFKDISSSEVWNRDPEKITQIIISSARLGSIDFAREIPDFTYRIVVPGILPHGRVGG
jgi:hypothetical protein